MIVGLLKKLEMISLRSTERVGASFESACVEYSHITLSDYRAKLAAYATLMHYPEQVVMKFHLDVYAN